jgi:hypothetical protein
MLNPPSNALLRVKVQLFEPAEGAECPAGWAVGSRGRRAFKIDPEESGAAAWTSVGHALCSIQTLPGGCAFSLILILKHQITGEGKAAECGFLNDVAHQITAPESGE